MFISEYLKLGKSFSTSGVFDALIDKDNNFFINIIRLKKSTVPEFVEAYQHLNSFFHDIAFLLNASDNANASDKMYKEARRKFAFHEVKGINLGFSKSCGGSGWGNKLSDKVLGDAYQIIKKGSLQPEIFHLVSLFEEGIAGDRLSDMIATIIEEHIKRYTQRMMGEFGINSETRKDLSFYKDGLIKNQFRKCPLLFVPTEILHELPIAKDWDDIDRVASENDAIRREMSAEIGAEWKKWATSEQKDYLFRNIFMQPDVCQRVIENYRNKDLAALDLNSNPEYSAEVILRLIKDAGKFSKTKDQPNSFDASMKVINIFKDWVENNRGWAVIDELPTRSREKSIQRTIHLCAKHYIEENGLDITFEGNCGNGSEDMKISCGDDKTITEIKLSTSGQYKQGYETQVKLYGKAENTEKTIFVFIDLGNSIKRTHLIELHERDIKNGYKYPELVIIDASKRQSASIFNEVKTNAVDDYLF